MVRRGAESTSRAPDLAWILSRQQLGRLVSERGGNLPHTLPQVAHPENRSLRNDTLIRS